jgi:hypothetical protein
MELNDIKYDFVINLTKFFVEKYRDGEIKKLDLIDRNVVQLAPFVLNFGHTFDESIWSPGKPEWYKNLIDFKVQLVGTLGYLPFRLFIKKGYDQKPILLIPGTHYWNWEPEKEKTSDEEIDYCTCDPRVNAPNDTDICFFCLKPIKR